jgi:hypothetical protein
MSADIIGSGGGKPLLSQEFQMTQENDCGLSISVYLERNGNLSQIPAQRCKQVSVYAFRNRV